MNLLTQLLHDYLVMFAMVNAIGNLPIFAELTQGMDAAERRRVFRLGVGTAGSIVFVFALLGNWMLQHVFEVDTAAFKIAGGILVFIVAVRGRLRETTAPTAPQQQYENVAVYPLGFPFLAGPGTIVTTILLFQTGGGPVTLAALALVYLTVWPLLHLAPFVERAIGRVGVLVTTRILSIFIAAKAVAFIVDGVRASLQLP